MVCIDDPDRYVQKWNLGDRVAHEDLIRRASPLCFLRCYLAVDIMGLTIQDLWDIWKKLWTHPVKTSISILVLIALSIAVFYGQGYFGEKGRRSASNSHVPSLDTANRPKLVTIASNEITLSGPGLYLVDTENKVETGYVKRISGLSVGDKAILKAASNDRTVVLEESRFLIMAAPKFYLNNENDKIVFIGNKDGVCVEDSRISLGD